MATCPHSAWVWIYTGVGFMAGIYAGMRIGELLRKRRIQKHAKKSR